MLRIETRTRLSPKKVIEQAVEFFGPAGCGLEVKEQGPQCAYFEGGGGIVEVTACAEVKKTRVELFSREWDYQVKQFIDRIAS